ncbi:MAG: hypothetical protein IE931_14565 [Sphingobacteriales bacterium]|nr:hypothetical protein [Sphingobacteriales bacterium]
MFFDDEINEIIDNLGGAYAAYVDGSNQNAAPIIALAEGWAYYLGHYLADKQYGTSASYTSEQTDANGYGIAY